MGLKGKIASANPLRGSLLVRAGGGGGGAVESVNGQTGVVVLTAQDVGALPDDTAIPDASSAAPAMDGTASAGSATTYARADHVHPSDTSRLAANQGAANAGKFMMVGDDGVLQPAERTPEVTVSSAGAVAQALDADTIYHFTGALTALTITLAAPSGGELAHYHFDFLSGSTAPTLTLPQTVVMPESFTVEANKRYEVDVLNNYGAVMAWANS